MDVVGDWNVFNKKPSREDIKATIEQLRSKVENAIKKNRLSLSNYSYEVIQHEPTENQKDYVVAFKATKK